ncbi:DUF3196 family protein [Sediminibacillus massiliensis]|uniref:DUF3196 family protein n=1 Tax=Sediminibacillus massiliensis TaxID=1926277 RepID=UPI0015C3A0FA|nr:DUF3196 family protein [Sediminibacillus massiliensis]
MSRENDNVILFPKWKDALEEESLQALKEKRYEDALNKLNKLIEHDVHSHEVYTGKIICLMELGHYEKAEELCRELIDNEDAYYFEYIHIYLTLLFQMSHYEEIISLTDRIFQTKKVPESLKAQLWQLYEMSKKLHRDERQDEAAGLMDELKAAVNSGDSVKQWRVLVKCRELEVKPYLDYIKHLLINDSIDPVVKTAIVQWLQKQEIDESIEVGKFGNALCINPSKLKDMNDHPVTKQILVLLREVEQNNPSLYELLEKLLTRYIYVMFPFTPDEGRLLEIAQALKVMGAEYLHIDASPYLESEYIDIEDIKACVEEILSAEKHYFSIIEE